MLRRQFTKSILGFLAAMLTPLGFLQGLTRFKPPAKTDDALTFSIYGRNRKGETVCYQAKGWWADKDTITFALPPDMDKGRINFTNTFDRTVTVIVPQRLIWGKR